MASKIISLTRYPVLTYSSIPTLSKTLYLIGVSKLGQQLNQNKMG